MSLEMYLAYLLACLVIVIVPGPTVTVIVANSITHGMRAGMLNVAGTQLGLAVFIAVVGLGLASLIAAMGWWFDWVKLAGAAYLIWLGWKLLRARADAADGARPPKPRGGFVAQGALVALSNPKTLLFFGAFFPQFIDPAGNYAAQIALLGVTAMAFAAASDSLYAILSGRAGRFMTRRRITLVTRGSGAMLIGGGIWLALQRSR
jgi:threonine/homoserine/homoserine lactone efflux protein